MTLSIGHFISPKEKFNILQQLKNNLNTGKIDKVTFDSALSILFTSNEEFIKIMKEHSI